MRAWAACGLSQAFSEELKNKKRTELPKMRHLFLMVGRGAGLMLALIFFMLLVNGNERKSCREIRNFNSPGSSLVSNPLTQSGKQVSYCGKICRFNLPSDNHENDNDLTKITQESNLPTE